MLKRGLNKKGDIGISFGMIFSVILIIFFVVTAFYVITKFIHMGNCTELGLFKGDIEKAVDRAVSGDGSIEYYPKQNSKINLPLIDYVCFFDSTRTADISLIDSDADWQRDVERYIPSDANMFFYPPADACDNMRGYKIEKIDIEQITETGNPYCIKNKEQGIKIEKKFGGNVIILGS